jgi:nitrite reductase/ring-hydroxylating ferredoxin subunit
LPLILIARKGTIDLNKYSGSASSIQVLGGSELERIHVGKVKDLKDGEMRMVRAGKKELLVVKQEERFYAIDGWCSHMGAPLDQGQVRDKTIRCRVHGAVFDLETGKVLQNLQAKDMRTYPVIIDGEDVYVEYAPL